MMVFVAWLALTARMFLSLCIKIESAFISLRSILNPLDVSMIAACYIMMLGITETIWKVAAFMMLATGFLEEVTYGSILHADVPL